MPASASALPFIVILAARSVGSPSADKSASDAQGLAAVEAVIRALNPPGDLSRVPFGLFAGSRLYGDSRTVKVDAANAGSNTTARPSRASQVSPPAALNPENPIIVGTFVLRYALPQGGQPKGTVDAVVGIVSLLVEGKTCYLRGAEVRWEVPGIWQEQLPAGKFTLSLASEPLKVSRSPVRFAVRALSGGTEGSASRPDFEQAVDRARIVHEAAAAQRADALPFAVRSEVMAAACSHFYGAQANSVANGPASLRVHREVTVGYAETAQRPLDAGAPLASKGGPSPQRIFPARAPRCGLQTSPFGSPLRSAAPDKTGVPPTPAAWSVQGCLDFAVAQVDRFTDELQKPSFAIISRTGRWVTLAGGRTAGLVVGSRLISANGAKLHVIRIVSSAVGGDEMQRQGDQAIAYVRTEDPKAPLVKGNQLTLDPQLYSDPAPPPAP